MNSVMKDLFKRLANAFESKPDCINMHFPTVEVWFADDTFAGHYCDGCHRVFKKAPPQ